MVVEHLGYGHVVCGVDVVLQREEILGIAQVLPQVGRHLFQIVEHPGKGTAVCLQHRIFGIGDEEGHVAIKGVDDHFHRIADVVQIGALGGL